MISFFLHKTHIHSFFFILIISFESLCVCVCVCVRAHTHMYWLVLYVNLTQAGVITEKGASVGEMPPRDPADLVAFSQLVIKRGGPIVDGATSGLVVLVL